MANTNESFIDEVNEAVRRDRLAQWFRRWGWVLVAAAVAVVALAGWLEWRTSQSRAVAQLRGEAVLTALELPAEERRAALEELPRAGDEGVIAALLLAAEQEDAGDAEGASATLAALASDGSAAPIWRDLAALKAQLVLGADADPAALDALAQPGQPYRLLAAEQRAMLDVAAGNRDAAVAALRAILEDAGIGPGQAGRVGALLTALGAPPGAEDASDADATAPADGTGASDADATAPADGTGEAAP